MPTPLPRRADDRCPRLRARATPGLGARERQSFQRRPGLCKQAARSPKSFQRGGRSLRVPPHPGTAGPEIFAGGAKLREDLALVRPRAFPGRHGPVCHRQEVRRCRLRVSSGTVRARRIDTLGLASTATRPCARPSRHPFSPRSRHFGFGAERVPLHRLPGGDKRQPLSGKAVVPAHLFSSVPPSP
jgi:hypothetical protein